MMRFLRGKMGLFSLAAFLGCGLLDAQEILLDKMEKAGGLTCFRSYGESMVYYYLPDRPRVAEKDGKPQFSFMKFVTNEETSGEGGTTKAKGGGVVHFLVEFDVPEADVRRAEQELARKVPGARVAGPIVYRSGTFSLVSTSLTEKGEYASRVLGLGKAPIMEGHKAAVSILLTREGATFLWENFKMSAPDISLQFEMEIAGYREPFEAEVTGDWSLIAKNNTMAAGLKTTWMGIDVQKTLKELEQENAIKIVQKGEDERSEKLVSLAYGKLVDFIFEQVKSAEVMQTLADDPNLFRNFETAAARNQVERARVASENAAAGHSAATTRLGVTGPPASYPAAERHNRGGVASTPSTATPSATPTVAATPSTAGKAAAPAATGAAGPARPADRRNPYDVTAGRQGPPSFSLLAAYRVKEFKSTGTFRLTFNKFAMDKLVFPIAENVGDLYSRCGDDPGCFKQVNLDDPVYKQREVIFFLDGQDQSDFAKSINFVTVTLRKEHQNGDVTTDELRIDAANYQSAANLFRMLYGWKGDDDRDRWLTFSYKTHWSLHGGIERESDWLKTDQFSVALAPPHRYRRIALEADLAVLEKQDVRMVTVDFYYKVFGQPQQQTVSMRVKPEELNKAIEYMHEPNALDYEFEIGWRQRGGNTISSGRQRGSDEVIFCDELPGT